VNRLAADTCTFMSPLKTLPPRFRSSCQSSPKQLPAIVSWSSVARHREHFAAEELAFLSRLPLDQ
jgi:hypothetical protein